LATRFGKRVGAVDRPAVRVQNKGETMTEWQKRIDGLVERLGSQEAVAKFTGVNKAIISKLRSGQRTSVRYDTGDAIVKACRSLKVSVD